MSNSVWMDQGQNFDPTKGQRYGLTCPYFDGRWLAAKGPASSLAYLHAVLAPSVGIYLCDPWQWPGPPTDPEGWADWAYATIQKQCAPSTSGDWPRVDLNYEHDDPDWLRLMLERWRAHSPKRTTAVVVNTHKASVYAPIMPDLAIMNVTVKPECYEEPADPVSGAYQRVESASEIQAWTATARLNVEPMLDAKSLGAWWGAVAASVFTWGRLP